MGRVRKYKKLKSCDPFYKGPKNIKSRGYDLPPPSSKKNDQISNNFRYFLDSVKESSGSSKVVEISKRNKKKKQRARQNTEINDSTKQTDIEVPGNEKELRFKKTKGESSRKFLARVEDEANLKLINAQKKAVQKSDRRKRYNKERKLKYQLKKLGVNLEDAEGMDFKDLKDHIAFGEVAQRPPDFTGINKKKTKSLNCTAATGSERQVVIQSYRNTKATRRTKLS